MKTQKLLLVVFFIKVFFILEQSYVKKIIFLAKKAKKVRLIRKFIGLSILGG